jgi:hypothetical protein
MAVILPLVPCPPCGDENGTANRRHGNRPGVRFHKCCHYSVKIFLYCMLDSSFCDILLTPQLHPWQDISCTFFERQDNYASSLEVY